MKKNLHTLPLERLDIGDTTYRYSTTAPENALIASIKKIGLVNPIVVQPVEKKYRIVTGFKRAAVLFTLGEKECPAFVSTESDVSFDLFMLAVQENLSVRFLNPIELAQILHKLSSIFFMDEETITKEVLPQLGYGRNPRVLQLYRGLQHLSEAWQNALIRDQVPIDFAHEMLRQSVETQDKMWQVISDFRLGKNRQREFFALLSDVAQIQNQSFVELAESEPITKIQCDEKLTPSQKTERLKAWLWEQRYPRYSQVKANFETMLRAARLPQNCFMQSPPYFEGDTYSAGFSFSSVAEFEDNMAALKRALENGTIKSILDLT